MQEYSNPESPNYEIRNNGDVIVISGTEQRLALIGKRIVEILNKSTEGPRMIQALLEGETMRPAGAYAVYVLMGKLYVDTRNARGQEQDRLIIKQAVETALTETP